MGEGLQALGLHCLSSICILWKQSRAKGRSREQQPAACCRQADGLPPLVALLKGGPRNQAAACAAGALANLVANNGINQDAAADAAAVEEVVTLLSAALADSACDRQVPLFPAKHCAVRHHAFPQTLQPVGFDSFVVTSAIP